MERLAAQITGRPNMKVPLLLLVWNVWLVSLSRLASAGKKREGGWGSSSSTTSTASTPKPTCAYPSLRRCLAAAKADAKAYVAQTCSAVLKGGEAKPRRRAQQGSGPAEAGRDGDENGDGGEAARWRRELEALVSALANKSIPPVTNDDIDMARATTLRNYPQWPPNSTLEEQMAVVNSVLAGNITCADFTQYYNTLIQVMTYGKW